MKKQSMVSLRLSSEDLEYLQLVAKVDDVSVGEAIREAVKQYVQSKSQEPDFRNKMAELRRNQGRLIEQLLGQGMASGGEPVSTRRLRSV